MTQNRPLVSLFPTQGDARIDAYKLQQQTCAKINDDLDAYCAMVRALAGMRLDDIGM
jgi:hypothetical protein